jgi:hypothetical protein
MNEMAQIRDQHADAKMEKKLEEIQTVRRWWLTGNMTAEDAMKQIDAILKKPNA